jgi:hypothetical protein
LVFFFKGEENFFLQNGAKGFNLIGGLQSMNLAAVQPYCFPLFGHHPKVGVKNI